MRAYGTALKSATRVVAAHNCHQEWGWGPELSTLGCCPHQPSTAMCHLPKGASCRVPTISCVNILAMRAAVRSFCPAELHAANSLCTQGACCQRLRVSLKASQRYVGAPVRQ